MTIINRIGATASAHAHQHQAKSADYLAAQLKPLDDLVTLKMFGEDDSGSASVGMRHGPVPALTKESLTKALGFRIADAGEMNERLFEFESVKNDPEFWTRFVETQEDPAVGEKAKALLTGKNVAEVVAMVVDEKDNRRPFAATAFLAARMNDGSLVYLRGTVGGMCF
ncbi:MAG TPA: hypothetical protein VGK67_04415 [Myxococcales bacterium]|jgi:hypothetical protein